MALGRLIHSHKTKFSLPFKPLKFSPLKHRKRILFALIALLAVIGYGTSTVIPLQVKVYTVHPAEFVKGFTEEAQVVAAQEWPIYNPLDGKVESLNVKNGDHVNQGQLLLKIDTRDLESQLAVLRAQLTTVEGQRLQNYRSPYDSLIQQQKLAIEQAEKDYNAQAENLIRMKTLYDAGAISQVQYEEAQQLAEKAKNALEQQKSRLQLIYEQQQAPPGTEMVFNGQKDALNAQIQQLEAKIQKAQIIAPQDGIIDQLSLKEGETIPQGQQLFKILKDQNYKLESYVLANDALAIKVGDPVEILQDTPNGKKTLHGKIESIDPSAVERISPLGLKENRVKVCLTLDTLTPLIFGSTLDVKFTTQKISKQLMVPKTALFPYQQGQAIWIVREGKAKIQPVATGPENGRQVVLTSGIKDGDTILLETDVKGLKEGKRIKGI